MIENRLKELRTSKGISMKQLSQKLLLPVDYINNYEHGVCQPTAYWAIKLAKYFGVSLDYFFKFNSGIGSNNLKIIRRQNNLTLQELHDLLIKSADVNVSADSLSKYERGDRNASVRTALAISDLYQIDVHDIFNIKKGKSYDEINKES